MGMGYKVVLRFVIILLYYVYEYCENLKFIVVEREMVCVLKKDVFELVVFWDDDEDEIVVMYFDFMDIFYGDLIDDIKDDLFEWLWFEILLG